MLTLPGTRVYVEKRMIDTGGSKASQPVKQPQELPHAGTSGGTGNYVG